MLHTTTKQLEICIDINIEITQVDHCTWMFTCRICRLALEITFLLNKYVVLQMTYELLSQRRNLISGGGGGGGPNRAWGLENIKKKISGGTLIRDSREYLNLAREKKRRHKNLTMTSCRQIMTSLSSLRFMANLQKSGTRIPDAQSVKLRFSLVVTFYLTKTENRTKKSLTQLSHYSSE